MIITDFLEAQTITVDKTELVLPAMTRTDQKIWIQAQKADVNHHAQLVKDPDDANGLPLGGYTPGALDPKRPLTPPLGPFRLSSESWPLYVRLGGNNTITITVMVGL